MALAHHKIYHLMLTNLSACRYSIHGPADKKQEQRMAEESFPSLVPGTDNCYHCGFHDGEQSVTIRPTA